MNQKYRKFGLSILLSTLASSELSYAAQGQSFPLAVSSSSASEGASVIPAGTVTRTSQNLLMVRIHNSCFGTNLRSVANPLSPSAIITAAFTLNLDNGSVPVSISYPARVVTANGLTSSSVGMVNASKYNLPAGSQVAINGRTIEIRIPTTLTTTVQGNGQFTSTYDSKTSISGASFSQTILTCGQVNAQIQDWGHPGNTIPPTYCGQYMGNDGVISASIGNITKASDNSVIDFKVAFPGQTGFCGGYYSPLMVFFDEARPLFNNAVSFPLNPSGRTMWQDQNAPGFFLALDKNGSKSITQKDQLFGGSEDAPDAAGANGFEALKLLDSNKDGKIDSKDKLFKKLVLWQDVNGNGISEKEEVFSLRQKGIYAIDLAYSSGNIRPLGKNAEEREKSKFHYIDKDGAKKSGEIIDIWLAAEDAKK